MNYVLEHEGRSYRKFFEEIAAIPHESFHEKALSDYIVAFAEKRGLWHHQDNVWNVIVKKPASPGYEDHEPVMMQGHIDMVCVKTPDSDHNFDKDPLKLYVKDGFLRAENTTLGADCGHGISYMLSILDDPSLKHPPLECLFTVQEEVGVGGPKYIDYSLLSAKRLIFTDSMGEGSPEMSTTSVLGGSYKKETMMKKLQGGLSAEIEVGGLYGGHAAVDINKGRGNAIQILARAGYKIAEKIEMRLSSFQSGTLKNNIPNQGKMTVAVRHDADIQLIKKAIAELDMAIKEEHGKTDPDPFVAVNVVNNRECALSAEDTKMIFRWLMQIPSGTYFTDPQNPAFPWTSRNLGTAELEKNQFTVGYMFRTSIKSHLPLLFERMELLGKSFAVEWEKEYDYPGYYREIGSPLYQIYEEVYEAATGKKLKPIHIHAGTDVGTILEHMGEMDLIGIGPNTYKFHTPEEALDLASYDRVYQYIIQVLAKL